MTPQPDYVEPVPDDAEIPVYKDDLPQESGREQHKEQPQQD